MSSLDWLSLALALGFGLVVGAAWSFFLRRRDVRGDDHKKKSSNTMHGGVAGTVDGNSTAVIGNTTYLSFTNNNFSENADQRVYQNLPPHAIFSQALTEALIGENKALKDLIAAREEITILGAKIKALENAK